MLISIAQKITKHSHIPLTHKYPHTYLFQIKKNEFINNQKKCDDAEVAVGAECFLTYVCQAYAHRLV